MQSVTPLVSVVCSCYNHGEFVETALNSVVNQTYKNIELLIVDDCSNDNSALVIEQWVSRNTFGTFIKNEKNLGLTKSFNNVFTKTKGTYIVDLAADDELLPNFIECLLAVFNLYNSNQVGIVYGNALVTYYNSNESYIYYDRFSQEKKATAPKDGYIYKELIDHSNTVCSVSAMIKRSVFEKLGGYDQRLAYEDYDFWIRVSRDYYILYKNKILVNRLKLNNSLGYSIHLGINKKNYHLRYSTYLVVKKMLLLNRTQEENKASMRKILIEIKANAKIFNPNLIFKYLLLALRFYAKIVFVK